MLFFVNNIYPTLTFFRILKQFLRKNRISHKEKENTGCHEKTSAHPSVSGNLNWMPAYSSTQRTAELVDSRIVGSSRLWKLNCTAVQVHIANLYNIFHNSSNSTVKTFTVTNSSLLCQHRISPTHKIFSLKKIKSLYNQSNIGIWR